MIRRLEVRLDGGNAAPASAGPVRLLAVSDERDPALEHHFNREQLGRLDGILGCGDLDPAYLCFLADAFSAPLTLVRGNHDRGAAWDEANAQIAAPLDGRTESLRGIEVIGLSWPGRAEGHAARDELGAWRQAIGAWLRAALRGRRPRIVISHVPPRGHGDVATDPYHAGFAGYAWLCRRLRPLLWLHGHTPPASGAGWRGRLGPTTLANVTGAVLIELRPAGVTIADK